MMDGPVCSVCMMVIDETGCSCRRLYIERDYGKSCFLCDGPVNESGQSVARGSDAKVSSLMNAVQDFVSKCPDCDGEGEIPCSTGSEPMRDCPLCLPLNRALNELRSPHRKGSEIVDNICVMCKKPADKLQYVLDEDGVVSGNYCEPCLKDGIEAGWIEQEQANG